VTHDQSEAMTVGDRVAVLREGCLEQLAAPRELHRRPATAFVARFIGTPPMSLLPALGGRAGPVVAPRPVRDGTLLGVRAEHVQVGAGEPLDVREVEDHGHEVLVAFDVAGHDLVARLPAGSDVRPGEVLLVRIDPDGVLAYDPDTGALL